MRRWKTHVGGILQQASARDSASLKFERGKRRRGSKMIVVSYLSDYFSDLIIYHPSFFTHVVVLMIISTNSYLGYGTCSRIGQTISGRNHGAGVLSISKGV